MTFRWWLGVGVATLGVIPLGIVALSFLAEYRSYQVGKSAVSTMPVRTYPTLESVQWDSRGTSIRGWFLPGSDQGVVVLLHGSGANRASVLPELEVLHAAGFGVLCFDWPGHGESGGSSQWGQAEKQALSSALDWLGGRGDVDHQRIGAMGFSIGGVPLLALAARDARIKAVAVAGTMASIGQFVVWEYRRWGKLGEWGALLAAHLRGTEIYRDVPRETVRHLSPRPLLVVLGEADQVVPAAMSLEIYQNAAEPKELLSLPNVGHCEYSTVPGEYANRIVKFFSKALKRIPAGGSL